MEESLKGKEEDLKSREKELEEMKNTISHKDEEIKQLKGEITEPAMDEDTRKILKILDDLLENLPEEIVDKFAKSNDYLLYEKVLDAYKI
jgi:septal ring factor EnvC (AmiA/AmiB activator)